MFHSTAFLGSRWLGHFIDSRLAIINDDKLMNQRKSVCCVEATIGVQGDDGQVVDCPVQVLDHLPPSDMFQAFDFEQFTIDRLTLSNNITDNDGSKEILEPPMSLREWMERVKPMIETENDDQDEEDLYSVSERTLLQLHALFIPIVRKIFQEHGFYKYGLRTYTTGTNETSKNPLVLLPHDLILQKYARPNYRKAADQYAQYLHNDAWFDENDYADSEYSPVAMVNVWFILNETPPRNTLVFRETTADQVRTSHMLHAHPVHTRNQAVVYDKDMAWGRFYVFIAGQRADLAPTTSKGDDSVDATTSSSSPVLLHGALTLPGDKSDVSQTDEIRRSVEMRYMLHAPKR